MKTTYWKRESISTGEIVALFKIEETDKEMAGFIYKDGNWQEYDDIVAKARYEDDYDNITEKEANSIMQWMGLE